MKRVLIVIMTAALLFGAFAGCAGNAAESDEEETTIPMQGAGENDPALVAVGTETYRGFTLDSVYHADVGEIHFHSYIPESYDGSKPYALFISLCGYGGYYFQGIGANIRTEQFVFEAQKYNSEMIIIAPQLNDWGSTSANQAIALTEYLLRAYNIDKSKVNTGANIRYFDIRHKNCRLF